MATDLISTDNRKAVMASAGYTFDKPVTAAKALKDAGLDWEVGKLSLAGLKLDDGRQLTQADDFGVTVRMDTARALGTISMKGYHVFQNDVIADLGDSVLDQGGNQVISAGSWKGSARIWMQFQVGEAIDLGGIDPMRATMMLTSGHDAGASLAAFVTMERLFCTNQMAMILKGAPRVYKIRHASTIDGRIQDIRAALGMSVKYQEAFNLGAQQLLGAKMTERQFGSFMDRLVPLPVDVEPDSRAATNRQEAIDAIRAIFNHGDDLDNVRGTRWAAFQAVTEYEDWGRSFRDTKRDTAATARFVKQQGDNPVKQRAWDMLLVK